MAQKVVFRQTFKDLPRQINWFPGHMRKAMDELGDELKKADLFIEVRDARIPVTSHNKDLFDLIKDRTPNMKRLVVFNKMDLANETKTLSLIKQLKSEDDKLNTVQISTKKNQNVGKMLTFIQSNVSPQFKTVGAWVLVGGIPNVGKSTIINALRRKDEQINHSKKSGARVGGVPCITKSITGFKIVSDPPTFMMDTPGIIIPKIRDDSEDGLKLCVCNNIRDGIVENDLVCDYLLFKLNKEGVFNYVNRYSLPMRKPTDSIHELTSSIMERFKLVDRSVAFNAFLRDFREGALGNLTFDDPLPLKQ